MLTDIMQGILGVLNKALPSLTLISHELNQK